MEGSDSLTVLVDDLHPTDIDEVADHSRRTGNIDVEGSLTCPGVYYDDRI